MERGRGADNQFQTIVTNCLVLHAVGLRGARPTKASELVDLSSKFGVSFGSESDSSDAEFVPGADSEGGRGT